jgi:hypothetical protein
MLPSRTRSEAPPKVPPSAQGPCACKANAAARTAFAAALVAGRLKVVAGPRRHRAHQRHGHHILPRQEPHSISTAACPGVGMQPPQPTQTRTMTRFTARRFWPKPTRGQPREPCSIAASPVQARPPGPNPARAGPPAPLPPTRTAPALPRICARGQTDGKVRPDLQGKPNRVPHPTRGR